MSNDNNENHMNEKETVQCESAAPNLDSQEEPEAERTAERTEERKEVSWADVCRKILMAFASMKFSFVLLFIIIAACLAGSILPQNAAETQYISQYGEFWTKVIYFLRLDHVFTCWWFTFLSALLCMNLILCSVIRFPKILDVWKKGGKKSIGIWGSWITHLGMLLVAVTFALSTWTAKEYVVYGIPGSVQEIGDTGYTLTIDSFETKLREDYTVEQYIAGLTVTSPEGKTVSGTSSVNYPFKAFGYTLYQDSTGWAEYVDIYKNKELVKTDLICTGEYTYPEDMPGLCLMFYKFYPDFAQTADGDYTSVTPLLNNPKSLYCIYYGSQMMGMNFASPGEMVEAGEYGFVQRDPTQYTLIVIKTDPMAPFVGISALILLAGLFICFYVKPAEKRRMV